MGNESPGSKDNGPPSSLHDSPPNGLDSGPPNEPQDKLPNEPHDKLPNEPHDKLPNEPHDKLPNEPHDKLPNEPHKPPSSGHSELLKNDRVVIWFRATGNAPILKQSKFKISPEQRFVAVVEFLRRQLRFGEKDPLVQLLLGRYAIVFVFEQCLFAGSRRARGQSLFSTISWLFSKQ